MGLHYYYPTPKLTGNLFLETDVCIYGGTSGGITAAIQASRLGFKTMLLVFNRKLGGMTASGLGATDIGNKEAFGGLTREFYQKVGQHYGKEESWTFEPKVAEKVFLEMLSESSVDIHYECRLDNVKTNGNRILSITTENGLCISAKVFIDATYEGDLMARSGVSYIVGRESNETYGEIYNGVHLGHPNHNFRAFVDPYNKEGDPRSGLLPGISPEAPGDQGSGDTCVQAYNFRMCLTQNKDRIPFPKPQNYDPHRYTLMARYLDAGVWDALRLTKWMPEGKSDTNNYGACSTDYIGGNHAWPDGSYATREKIFQDHLDYTQGMFWFLSHDPRVPNYIREEVHGFGLPTDEFVDNGGWPHELYIREGRRMISDYVMTEHNCVKARKVDDPIALAAYQIDSHNCRRIVLGGRVFNEGNVEIGVPGPYSISYRSLVPKRGECSNLIVPFCLSSSHTGFGSIRMEPVFMALGQVSATAASCAITQKCPVQDVDYTKLTAQLSNDGHRLEWPVKS